ncbi:hypothetical protein Tco_0427652 [Tanacetum coccineum]
MFLQLTILLGVLLSKKSKPSTIKLKLSFPRLFALEVNKDCSVADKLNAPFTASFRRQTRGGPEAQQLEQLTNLLDSVSLSNMEDRCFWDLNGEGVFQVKDVRSVLDETFLPKENIPTRWVKSIPIKVNVFVWKLVQDQLRSIEGEFESRVQDKGVALRCRAEAKRGLIPGSDQEREGRLQPYAIRSSRRKKQQQLVEW